MFRNGPEGLRGRAGSRPWRPSGHARVAIMLMFNAVATCTSPPSTLVPYIVPDVQSRVYGHPFHALSSLLGVRTSHGSVHLPSGAVANPESPVLGVEPQHRIRKLRAATKSPEQRVDVHAAALSLTPHSEQRVNFSASATNADSLMHASHTVWLPRCRSNFAAFCCCAVTSEALLSLDAVTIVPPLLARSDCPQSVVRLEGSPYLMQPFALRLPRSPVTPTGGATPLPSHNAICTNARRESGRVRDLVQGPVTNTSSLRGNVRCLWGAKSFRTRHSHGGPRWH